MGYTHGKQWSDDMIRAAILGVQNTLCINRMPTRSECETVTGSHSLSNAITRHGGWYRWAEIMGLPIKESETTTGKTVEALIAEKLKVIGHEVQRMSQNHPYDLLLDGCVKIDVKASHICKGRTGDYYSFNLEKKNATCDFYVLVVLGDDSSVLRTLVVPSCKVTPNKQISIGVKNSKYHVYTDRWDLLHRASEFWKGLVA